MSTLALRNYGLVLPKNYVSIDEAEMEYINGGWSGQRFMTNMMKKHSIVRIWRNNIKR